MRHTGSHSNVSSQITSPKTKSESSSLPKTEDGFEQDEKKSKEDRTTIRSRRRTVILDGVTHQENPNFCKDDFLNKKSQRITSVDDAVNSQDLGETLGTNVRDDNAGVWGGEPEVRSFSCRYVPYFKFAICKLLIAIFVTISLKPQMQIMAMAEIYQRPVQVYCPHDDAGAILLNEYGQVSSPII